MGCVLRMRAAQSRPAEWKCIDPQKRRAPRPRDTRLFWLSPSPLKRAAVQAGRSRPAYVVLNFADDDSKRPGQARFRSSRGPTAFGEPGFLSRWSLHAHLLVFHRVRWRSATTGLRSWHAAHGMPSRVTGAAGAPRTSRGYAHPPDRQPQEVRKSITMQSQISAHSPRRAQETAWLHRRVLHSPRNGA